MINNVFRLLLLIILISVYSVSFASYESRTKKIDQLIETKMKTIKSSEKLDIPEYKGDTLTFERLSKIRNVFNIDHLLPFEKRKPIVKSEPEKKVVKLKPIVVPKELQIIMKQKSTKLQQYPISSFKFKGVVYQNEQRWGVVENSMEKNPLYLKEGMLIGRDYGQVSDITKEGIVVNEWKKNTQKRVWEKIQTVIH
ncbi:pilus assembly protein PilP [Candidatus Francisella endociliophora]|nr:pilus assembly protein PilP [Francisella sp. FSC1006]